MLLVTRAAISGVATERVAAERIAAPERTRAAERARAAESRRWRRRRGQRPSRSLPVAERAQLGLAGRGQGHLLRRLDRRTVGGQPLAIAGVGAPRGPDVHGREDFQHLIARQRLVLEQLLDEDFPGLVMRRLDQAADLVVDRRGDLLGVVPAVRHLAAEERLAVTGAELPGPEPLAH